MKIWYSYRTVLVATTVYDWYMPSRGTVVAMPGERGEVPDLGQTASASRIGIRIVRVPVLAAAAVQHAICRNNHTSIRVLVVPYGRLTVRYKR